MWCSFRARVASHWGLPAHFSYCCCAWVCRYERQGEEPRATPSRAGDGAGDGGQARIPRALPVEALGRDGDGVALALIVAKEHRAGFEPASGRAAVARQTVSTHAPFALKVQRQVSNGVAGLAAAGSSLDRQKARPSRAQRCKLDDQRPRRTLAEDPGSTRPELRIPGTAAQTRTVSGGQFFMSPDMM